MIFDIQDISSHIDLEIHSKLDERYDYLILEDNISLNINFIKEDESDPTESIIEYDENQLSFKNEILSSTKIDMDEDNILNIYFEQYTTKKSDIEILDTLIKNINLYDLEKEEVVNLIVDI